MKSFSLAKVSAGERVLPTCDALQIKSNPAFIRVGDRKWWLACVLEINPDESEVSEFVVSSRTTHLIKVFSF